MKKYNFQISKFVISKTYDEPTIIGWKLGSTAVLVNRMLKCGQFTSQQILGFKKLFLDLGSNLLEYLSLLSGEAENHMNWTSWSQTNEIETNSSKTVWMIRKWNTKDISLMFDNFYIKRL